MTINGALRRLTLPPSIAGWSGDMFTIKGAQPLDELLEQLEGAEESRPFQQELGGSAPAACRAESGRRRARWRLA